MGEIYAAHYRWTAAAWHVVVPPALYTLEALHARWQRQPAEVIAGTAPSAFAGRLSSGAALIVADARPAARALLACARASWARGDAVDPGAALPVYLRDKVALTSAERAAAKTAHGSS